MVKKYYYNDELNDDFSTAKIPAKPLGDYKYERGFIWKIFAGIFYRIIVFPIATAYNLVLHHERIKNRKLLKKYRKSGYFLYCNHTMDAGDAYTPSRIVFPKKAYIVVGPQAVQIPVVKHLVPALGGVPVPSDLAGLRKFNAHIKKLCAENKVVTIYPESHVWPYYTGIRPFKDASFTYPAENGKPVFCATKTFIKRLIGSRPRVTVYIDGPFFPDENLSLKERKKKLRDEVYATMKKRSKLSDYQYIVYEKVKESKSDGEAA